MHTALLEAPDSNAKLLALQKTANKICQKLDVSQKMKLRKGLISTENLISPQINTWVENVAKKNGVAPEDYRLFKKTILDIVEEEYERERMKNEQGKISTLQQETKGKIHELLERKEKGKIVTDKENAEAIIEQLKTDEMVKIRVFEYLNSQFGENYKLPKKPTFISEEQEKKAQLVVKRLLMLNNGRVAKYVYKKLKDGEPDRYKSVEKQQKKILKELGLDKAFNDIEKTLEPALSAKGEFNRKIEYAYQLINEIKELKKDKLKNPSKIKKVKQLSNEIEASMRKVMSELPQVRESLEKLEDEIGTINPEVLNENHVFILEKYQGLDQYLTTLPKPSYGSLNSLEEQYLALKNEMKELQK
jgi:hypothetical protein